jgi:hypothetical protein
MLAGLLNGLLFDPEDGGSTFFRNLDEFYRTLYRYVLDYKYECGENRGVISENFRKFKSITVETFTKQNSVLYNH